MRHEDQGTGYDPGAAGHERQGREAYDQQYWIDHHNRRKAACDEIEDHWIPAGELIHREIEAAQAKP